MRILELRLKYKYLDTYLRYTKNVSIYILSGTVSYISIRIQ